MADQYAVKIEVLEYFVTRTAGAGTTTTNLTIADHELNSGDFIVNTTKRSTTQNGSERGSRRITKVDDNNVTVPAIASQTSGDTLRLYRYTDRSEYLDSKSFSLTKKVDISSCSFRFAVDYDEYTEALEYEVYEGQYIRISLGDWHGLTGIVHSVGKKLISEAGNRLLLSIEVVGLDNIPYRRTIKVDYPAGHYTDYIVENMVTDYLIQEGITIGTINSGVEIGEVLNNDSASIGEILDLCAQKNGFIWNIDDYSRLNFYEQPATISNSPLNLIDGGEFTDYRNVQLSGTIDNYVNKSYFVGGKDENGNQVYNSYGDLVKQNYMQNITAGSAIYGLVTRDSGNVEMTKFTSASGTNTTNITITSHGLAVGDFLWNKTRNRYTFVTAVVNANNVTVESVASQTSGDIIIFYHSANATNKNIIKKQGTIQRTLTFDTTDIFFFPGTKLNVSLKKLGIVSSYWNIEEVVFTAIDLQYFRNTVTAVLRDNSNFSIQKRPDALSFFKSF